ncbi:hypothetical protein D6817_02515 [Candidatus Pacearchaeota archaeon]|nr:MAG: hypothetical protein D6817_02515 [Candidatus Pacearchaeota archaeon]
MRALALCALISSPTLMLCHRQTQFYLNIARRLKRALMQALTNARRSCSRVTLARHAKFHLEMPSTLAQSSHF